MTQPEILSKVSEVVAEVLQIDDPALSMSSTADQVEGWDSVSNVMIMVALEQAFGVRFRTGEMGGLENIGALVERIEHHLK